MTDRPAPTFDVVEERLRRTLVARADDMRPGDTEDGGLVASFVVSPARSPGRSPSRRRALAGAAVVMVAALVAGGIALVTRIGDGDETGRVATDRAPAPGESTGGLVVAPRDLVVALESEREMATTTLLGLEAAIVLPVTDNEQARSGTDAAVAAFQRLVGGSPEAGAYQPGLDALAALDQLRGDIDAASSSRGLGNIETAMAVSGRYSQIIGGLLDTHESFVLGIDDPDVRHGAEVYWRGLALQESTAQLGRVAMLAGVAPGTTTIAELSRLHTTVQQELDALGARATGTPYEDAAVTAIDELRATGLVEAAGATIEGDANFGDILSAVEMLADRGWPAFLDRVEDLLADTR